MFNRLSIRSRITILTVLLLTICCIGLTLVLNKSAAQMAESLKISTNNIEEIEATPVIPSNKISEEQLPLESIEAAEKTYQSSSIMYMIYFIGIGGLLTYIIIDKALKPLKDLSNEIKNKSIENLSDEITINKREDEIYDLTISFNKMTKKINEAYLMQKRFSNNAAHELRTPLAVMRTKLDVFKKRKSPKEEEYNKLIDSMSGQLLRLSDIVNSLLNLTNMEEIDLSEKINLKKTIDTICNELYFIAEKKNIKINVIGKEAIIEGNYDLMHRAFYNLIENAIKYNNENGKVEINIKSEDEVIIKDTGIGIPDNMKENIFEPFFTVDKSRSRKLGGAGIGLSIVKSIIENHKGKIIINDNKEGGSIFIIKFKKDESLNKEIKK